MSTEPTLTLVSSPEISLALARGTFASWPAPFRAAVTAAAKRGGWDSEMWTYQVTLLSRSLAAETVVIEELTAAYSQEPT